MALMGELTGQGRVVGGYLVNSVVMSSKDGLSIQLLVKKHKITAETVTEWEELTVEKGAAKVINSVAGSILPKGIGKTVGAALGASISLGHTVRVLWVDGQQSIIELPEKLFMILKSLLTELEIKQKPDKTAENSETKATITEQIFDLASRVLPNNEKNRPSAEDSSDQKQRDPAKPDVIQQLDKLSTLKMQGVLSEEEFNLLKANLLKSS